MTNEGLNTVKAEAKRRIHNLVEDYMTVLAKGKKDAYNEERVKIAFIVPLLEVLGWNPRTDEVLPEQATLTGRADFGLRCGGRTKIFVEMKSFNKSLDGYDTVKGRPRSYTEQAIQYAWGMKADWAVLTNFEETRLYDSHVKKPEDGLVWKKHIRFTEYESRFDELWLISKESVISGALDAHRARGERPPVDEAFLIDLMNCRQLMAEDIKENNPGLTYDLINESVQKILDRLIFIKNCEDRLIIPAESLWKRFKAWQETAIDRNIVTFMMDLRNLFRYFDQVYNGKLFEKHPSEDLKISNHVFEEIIDTLYGDGQHLGYNFSVIPVDVLGQAYELYIGSITREKEGLAKAIEIVREPTRRKAQGIYYTPEYIVDHIVRNTLSKVLEKCRTPEDVSEIKVVDPACGSGSFLIKAFDLIKQWYDSYNEKNRPNISPNTLDAHFMPAPNVEERILTQNLYGVDLDPQAVEITILNLSLKAVRTKSKLPYIGDHVKCGNSLVDGSPEILERFFENPEEKKPFNWELEFPDVFKKGGFDVVVGNPPYVRIHALPKAERNFFEHTYESAQGQYDLYVLFIEKSLKLLKEGGNFGFIIPRFLLFNKQLQPIRNMILQHAKIDKITAVGKAFEDSQTENIILFFSKDTKNAEERLNKRITISTFVEDSDRIQDSLVQSTISNSPYKTFNIYLTEIVERLLNKIRSGSIQLNQLVTIRRGIEQGRRGIIPNRPDAARVLVGEEVTKYGITFRDRYIDKKDKRTERLEKYFETPEKILVRRVCDKIIATYDNERYYCLKNLYVLVPKRNLQFSLKFLTGALNSALVNYFYGKVFTTIKEKIFPEIRIFQLEQLPIPEINLNNPNEKILHDKIVEYVDKVLTLRKQLSQINDVFENYLTEPIVGYALFRDYYEELKPVSEKLALDRTSIGRIKNLKVQEQDEWLIFRVDYFTKGERHNNVEVLKCKFEDVLLRKFLFCYINNYKEPFGSGNLLSKILAIKIPCFDKDPIKNKEIIKMIIKNYLVALQDKKDLEEEIAEILELIDSKFYEIYGLNQTEILLMESSGRN